MIASSIVTGLLGIVASIFPGEILAYSGATATETLILLVQITGALYFGFAIMNWMAKAVLIGGIYARPLAMGNFAHYLIAEIALIKAAANHSISPYLWIVAIIYTIFALLFGMVLFTNPARKP